MNFSTPFSKKESPIKATAKLLSILDVHVTLSTLENDLSSHPDYPSLLSVSDALTSYGVSNITLKTTDDKLTELPLPGMVLLKGAVANETFFTVIESIDNDKVRYYQTKNRKWKIVTVAEFLKIWPTKMILLTDPEGAIGEKNYISNRRHEKLTNAAKSFTWLSLPILVVLTTILASIKYNWTVSYPVIFSILSLIGCGLAVLLLWYEVDEYNPVLQQICSAGTKTNCGAILNSKASKIAGISWSAIGFTYFAGGLFTLIFVGFTNKNVLFILGWFNIIAVPYVFFSVYYQLSIAKQWCVLCLGVQVILVLQLITTLTAKWSATLPLNSVFNEEIMTVILFAYAIPSVAVSLLLPLYRSAKEGKRNLIELQRIKHDPQIFEALLTKQKVLTESPSGLGIAIGSKNPLRKIIKVCSPYCGPCANAHKPLEELLDNNPDLQVQILFTSSSSEGDRTGPPVKHLLSIAEKDDEVVTKQALDKWYLSEKKDYEAFASMYAINDDLNKQNAKVDAMKDWCDRVKISFTPTFFISIPSSQGDRQDHFYQLPPMYSVTDLKSFLAI